MMKKVFVLTFLVMLCLALAPAGAQDRDDELYGMPGDNLNLFAVMKLFRESPTLENFERKLNDEHSAINNLDLNGDRLVDYITVNDYVQGDLHTIVLRVAMDDTENQDVAVFTVQRFSDGSVQVQLIGDEALYGRDYIVEPNYGDYYGETVNPGYSGNQVYSSGYSGANGEYYGSVNNGLQVVSDVVSGVVTTALEVAAWPLVTFLFRPAYIAWRSLWGWNNYPVYWTSWHPWGRYDYYSYHDRWFPHYYREFRHWDHLRCSGYHDFYYRDIRAHSPRFGEGTDHGSRRYYGSRSLGEPQMRSEATVYRSRTIHSSGDQAGRFRQGSDSMGDIQSSAARSTRPAEFSRSGLTASNRQVATLSGRRSGNTTNGFRSATAGNSPSRAISSSRNIRYTSSANHGATGRVNNSMNRPTVSSTAGRSNYQPSYTMHSGVSRRQVTAVSGRRNDSRTTGMLKSSSGRSANAFSGRAVSVSSARETGFPKRGSSAGMTSLSTGKRSMGHNSAISGGSSGNRSSQHAFSGRSSHSRGAASSGGGGGRSSGHSRSSRR